jgi:hypothetical protein
MLFGGSDGLCLYRSRRGHVRPVRPVCSPFEARLIMIVAVIYIAAAVGVAVYMLAALLRPEKF